MNLHSEERLKHLEKFFKDGFNFAENLQYTVFVYCKDNETDKLKSKFKAAVNYLPIKIEEYPLGGMRMKNLVKLIEVVLKKVIKEEFKLYLEGKEESPCACSALCNATQIQKKALLKSQ